MQFISITPFKSFFTFLLNNFFLKSRYIKSLYKQVISNLLSITKSYNLFCYEKFHLKYVLSKRTTDIFKLNHNLNEVLNCTSIIAKYFQLC